jgi:hypothetical protein
MSVHHCKIGHVTRYGVSIAAIMLVASGAQIAPAGAGPCTEEIAKFDRAMQQSAGDPYAGLTAVQTTSAQLDRQPTPASIARAETHMKSRFATELQRARRDDAKNDGAGCNKALAAAKRMYILK